MVGLDYTYKVRTVQSSRLGHTFEYHNNKLYNEIKQNFFTFYD